MVLRARICYILIIAARSRGYPITAVQFEFFVIGLALPGDTEIGDVAPLNKTLTMAETLLETFQEDEVNEDSNQMQMFLE